MNVEDFEPYRKHLIALAFRILADSGLAEDVAQEAIIAALRCKEPIRDPKMWLRATAKGMALTVLRTEKRRKAREQAQAKSEVPHIDSRHLSKTMEALFKIELVHRQILVWKYIDNQEDAWIAEVLGIGEPQAKRRLKAAMDAFRAKWIELSGAS